MRLSLIVCETYVTQNGPACAAQHHKYKCLSKLVAEVTTANIMVCLLFQNYI